MKNLCIKLRLPLAAIEPLETPTPSGILQSNLSAWTELPRLYATPEYQPDYPILYEAAAYLMEMEMRSADRTTYTPPDEAALETSRLEWEEIERRMILRGEVPRRAFDEYDCTIVYTRNGPQTPMF
jgi:hypothetical protein